MKIFEFNPLSSVDLSNIEQSVTPTFFESIRYTVYFPDDSILFTSVLEHLSKDRPDFDLETGIQNMRQLLQNHNNDTRSLEQLIPVIVRTRFKKHSGCVISNEQYDYNYNEVLQLLVSIWGQLYKNNDVQSAINNYDLNSLSIQVRKNSLLIGGKHIRDGNDKDRNAMFNILTEIIKDTQISQKLIDLISSESNLRTQLEPIRHMAREISDLIEKGLYKTKVKCCPTFLKMIEDYVLP